MPISFATPTLFNSKEETKVSLKISKDMLEAIDQLAEVMGMDRSKMCRWCFEAVLKEAIEQKKLVLKNVG